MKRSVLWISTLILWLSVTGAVLAKPDLVVTNLSLEPERPIIGESVTITATVGNVGTNEADVPFSVRFTIDGVEHAVISIPFGLERGRFKTVSAGWIAEVGTHTVVAEADQPFNRVDESNEANNSLGATLVVSITASSEFDLARLKVAVARFDDRSGSGFINVGEGVADELIERLVNSGVRVLERSELEAVMQERSLNPAITGDLATAGQVLGADLVIVGSVTKVDVKQATFSLGFFSISSATVDVAMSARLVNVYTTEIMRAVSSEGREEGATGFSVDIGKILALSQPVSTGVCSGGLLTDRPSYFFGEMVHIGYRHSGGLDWYRIDMYTGGGIWLKSLNWQYLSNGDCGEWFWDQRDGFGVQLSPGTYTAKLYEFSTGSYVAAVNFQIKPGASSMAPMIDEITVGSDQFDETIVGKATNSALNQLVGRLIQGMGEVAPAVTATRGVGAFAAVAPKSSVGQVAEIFSDGRVAVTLGASAGLSRGDFLEVLEVTNLVIDPNTGEILAYDVLGVKGEIVLVEVRDRVSYGVKTSDFNVLIGDIVRLASP